ncbi:MAG: protein kinase [Verrucomicrobiales bacterium]|nr:protein kinase [Verrucomicrobiales bacterium]
MLNEPKSPGTEPLEVDSAALAAAGLAPAPPVVATDRFGDYRLEGEIGRGGMGIIYRAHQLSLNRAVALKMILAGPLNSQDFARRLRVEAEAAARLDHPHIVPIYEVGEHEGQPFYAMRLVEGLNLAQALKAGPFEPRAAATLLVTVAQAVQHAHERGVLHRDLKPSNILLDAAGQPHVSDFGLAKFVHQDSSLTLSHAALGTPSYMAPEQAAGGSKTVTTAADVYSLGAILYELLTGRPLFRAETPLEAIRNILEREPERPSRVNPRVPRDLEIICLKCLQKEPGRRYGSAAALAEELGRWLEAKPIRARRVGWVERGGLWCRRKPALAALAGALVVTLVVASAVAAWRIAVARGHQRREAYYAAVALADRFIEDGSPHRAMELLLECPEELRHWEWGYLVGQCHQEVLTISAHARLTGYPFSSIRAVAFDAPGERLITLGQTGQLKVWDAHDGEALWSVGDSDHPVTQWVLHPRVPELLFCQTNGLLRRVQVADPRDMPVPPLATEAGPVSSLAYAPDGTTAASVTRPGRVTLWDTATARVRWQVSLEPVEGEQVALREAATGVYREVDVTASPRLFFDSGGRRLIAQGLVTAWWLAADSGAVLASRELDPLQHWGLWVAPDGESVVTLDIGGELELSAGGKPGRKLGTILAGLGAYQRQVAFSPDSRYFCTGGDAGTARVYALPGGEEVRVLAGHVFGGRFSPDGGRLAVYGSRRFVSVLNLERANQDLTLRGHLMTAGSAAFSSDGRRLATADWDGSVKVWSALPGRSVWPVGLWPKATAASTDGRWALGCISYGDLQVWETASGMLARAIPARWSQPYLADFSPNNRWVVTTSTDPIGRVWDVSTGQLVGALLGGSNVMFVARFSPDGRWIASVDTGGVVSLWEVPSFQRRWSVASGLHSYYGLAISPSSDRLVLTGGSGQPLLLDLPSGRQTWLPVEAPGFWSVAFSPDGRWLAFTSPDGILRLLDASTWRLVTSSRSQGRTSVAGGFSADGRRTVMSTTDSSIANFEAGLLQIWDVESGRELLALGGRSDFFDTARFVGPGNRQLVAPNWEGTMCQWEAFPWRDRDYAHLPGPTLAARIRAYATEYWRERLRQEQAAAVRPDPDVLPVVDDLFLPARDPRCGPEQLDLERWYNGRLDGWLHPTSNDLGEDFTLAALPAGWQTLLGIRFDIRGVVVTKAVERRGGGLAEFWLRQPVQMEGLAVGQRVRRLHVLQAACPAEAVSDGTTIGSYVWHYSDGTTHEEPIVYGRDLRYWWLPAGEAPQDLERGRIAWVGDTPLAQKAGARIRLYLTTYDNPYPEREVSQLGFTSRVLPSAPFLVALTVEP